jgi:hypothetical protein
MSKESDIKKKKKKMKIEKFLKNFLIITKQLKVKTIVFVKMKDY